MTNINILKKELVVAKNNLLLEKNPVQIFFNNDLVFSKIKFGVFEDGDILKINKLLFRKFIEEDNFCLKFPLKVKTFKSANTYNKSKLKNFSNDIIIKYYNLIINTSFNKTLKLQAQTIFLNLKHVFQPFNRIFLIILASPMRFSN
jgi:hypothetical protein